MPSVRILGPVDVVADDRSERAPTSDVRRSILALLALENGRVVESERLLDQAWGGAAPASGLRALRFHVSRLRSEIGIDGLIETVGSGYRLIATVDVAEAEAALSTSDPAALRAALRLWRGEALADLDLGLPFDHERERLAALRLEVTEQYFRQTLASGETSTIVGDLTKACLENPLREGLWSCLVEMHWTRGEQAEALRAYDRIREQLVESVGAEPGIELQQLHQRVLTEATPSPRIRDAEIVSLTNLPVVDDLFVGREDDVRAAAKLLATSRVMTLAGLGGIGKTRLAINLGNSEMSARSDGVWFCDLAAVDDGKVVARVVADVLGANQFPGQSMARSVADFCTDRQLLLVLDNCEQVTDAVADLVEQIIAVAPGVQVLATSREPLNLAVEQVYPVGALGHIGPGSASAELFRRRALQIGRTQPWSQEEQESVGRICERLEGIPLAVELAAARSRVLSPVEIESHLENAIELLRSSRRGPDRHRTLEASIDWSYDQLDETEQLLFRRLSVFRGGAQLEGIRGVTDFAPRFAARTPDDGHARDDEASVVLSLVAQLESLVEKSLVVPSVSDDNTTRYRLAEPLRQYAERRLGRSGEEAETRCAHLAHYARWSAAWSERELGPGLAWKRQFDTEFANLHAAVSWGVQSRELQRTAELIAPLFSGQALFLRLEIGDWAMQVVELPGFGSGPVDAVVASIASMSHWWRGDLDGLLRYAVIARDVPGADPTALLPAYTSAILAAATGDQAASADVWERVNRADPIIDATVGWVQVLRNLDDVEILAKEWSTLDRLTNEIDSSIVPPMRDMARAYLDLARSDYGSAAVHASRGVMTTQAMGLLSLSYHGVVALIQAGAFGERPTRRDLLLVRTILHETRVVEHFQDQWLIMASLGVYFARSGRLDLAQSIAQGVQESVYASWPVATKLAEAIGDRPDETSNDARSSRDELFDATIEALDEELTLLEVSD